MNIELKVDIFEEDETTKIRLLEPVPFVLNGKTVIIPVGFVSDGASIPRFLWRLLDPPVTASTLRPSVIHDYLYRYQICTRKKADVLYDKLLAANGYNSFKRWLVYRGLRWRGGDAWDWHTKELETQK